MRKRTVLFCPAKLKAVLVTGLAAICLAGTSLAADLTLTDDMVLWLKADAGLTVGADGRVTAWADQSGLGNDATALNYGPRVLENGSPSGELNLLDFILDGSVMSIADYADLNPGTGGYTVFVAGSPWLDASSRALMSKADGTSSKDPGFSIWAGASSNTNVRATGGPVPDPDDYEARRASQSIAMSGNLQVITMSLTGTNGGTQPGYVTGYRDGVDGWTNGGNGPSDNQYSLDVTSASDLYIGGYGYLDDEDEIHASYPHRGTIGEILIYNTELSAADRATVESYLIERWSGAAPAKPNFNSHYNFNESLAAGRTVYDRVSGVHGAMGRENNAGELLQSPTRVDGGVTGNALQFTRDAASTGQEVHDFVTLGASAFYAPENGSPLTFSAWINPDTISTATTANNTAANRIMGLYRDGSAYSGGIAVSLGKGVANGEEFDGNLLTAFRVGSSWVTFDSSTTLSTDDTSGPNGDGWHHVAFSFDGANLDLYIDGVDVGGGTLGAYTKGSLDYNVIIGCNQQKAVGASGTDWFTSGFGGMVDDVQFYTYGLSGEEVSWLLDNPGMVIGEVPEPASMILLLGVGGALILVIRRRRSC